MSASHFRQHQRAATLTHIPATTAESTKKIEHLKMLAGKLVHPYLDAMPDDEADALVQAVIHPSGKFYMQGVEYCGKTGYLKYRQVVRQAWKDLLIINDKLLIEPMLEQGGPHSLTQVKVEWTIQGTRANPYAKHGLSDECQTMMATSPMFSGFSLYTFNSEGLCVQGVNSYNAQLIVEQLQKELHELTRLQRATADVRNIAFSCPKPKDVKPLDAQLVPKFEEPKVSGIEMVLTLVNSMTGDFFLAIPYGMQQAGLLFGSFLICLTSSATCYTALLVLRLATKLDVKGFADLSNHYIGRPGYYLTHMMNLLIFVGTCCANFVFLKDNFVAISSLASSFGFCSELVPEQAVALVAVSIFGISMLAKMSLLVQFNSLAAVCSAYILFWQLTSCSLEMHITGLPQELPGYPGGLSFGVLPGMMTYTLLVHGWILPVVETLKDKSRAAANITVSVAITTTLLIIAGVASVLAFGAGHQVPENFLTDFNQQKPFPFSCVIALTIEALVFTPLMLFLSKETLQEVAYGVDSASVPSWVKLCLNTFVISLASTVAIAYPNVGDVMGWIGAVCGLLLGFLFPSMFLIMEDGASVANCLKCTLVVIVGVASLGLQVANAVV